MELLQQHIEALIFATPDPLSAKEFKSALDEAFETKVSNKDIEKVLTELEEKYKDDGYAFELTFIAGGYQFMTKGAYHNSIALHLKQTTKKKPSRAGLETLAIVSKQTRSGGYPRS